LALATERCAFQAIDAVEPNESKGDRRDWRIQQRQLTDPASPPDVAIQECTDAEGLPERSFGVKGVESNLAYRDATPPDFVECVRLLSSPWLCDAADHEALRAMWGEIVATKSGLSSVATINASVAHFAFVVFVSDELADSYHRLEKPLIARRLLLDWRKGLCPFLRLNEIARHNASGGVNLVVPYYGADLKLPNTVLTTANYELARRMFLGWNVRTFTTENFRRGRYDGRSWGSVLGYHIGTYSARALHAAEIPKDESPCLWMATRDDADNVESTMLALLFSSLGSPRCAFTFREQEVLLLALEGTTDDGIAHAIGVSNSTAKRLFRSIYEKAEHALGQEVFTGMSLEPGIRGAEIRRRLLNYVRQHPNELKPWDASA
jgi:hypothetical protein